MPRFLVDSLPLATGELSLPDDVVRHLQVLRLRTDDSLTLFDGIGGEWSARLVELGRRSARVHVEAFQAVERESPLLLSLAQGVSTGDRMEFTLQKGVELGIAVFQPLVTERAMLKLAGERAERKHERWNDIVRAACEQCGRNRIPEIRPLMTLAAFLAQPRADDAARFILSPAGERRLADYPAPQAAWLLAGPEGGLSTQEEAAAMAAGWEPLRLGPRVLRTETAALAAAAAMQTLWGDFA